MKKIVIIIAVFMFDIGVMSIQNEANGQVAEVRVKKVHRKTSRKKVRRINRRVTRRAHIRYAGMPVWKSVATLPKTAIVLTRNGIKYHYHAGVFYRHYGGRYVVGRPVVGIRVTTIPAARRKIIVQHKTYYYYYGTYYQKSEATNDYVVVLPPEGALVDALPEGYEVKSINGTEYYVLEDVYYREISTDEMPDGIGYEVVKV